MDPLARQLVTSRGFRGMTEQVLQVAAEVCDGRVAMVQEGGYSPIYVPFCGHAVIETPAGVKVLDHALFPVVGQMTGHGLAQHQKALVDEVAALVLPA
jgi:acetoin utilization deacetylase AcuC-like enzyme